MLQNLEKYSKIFMFYRIDYLVWNGSAFFLDFFLGEQFNQALKISEPLTYRNYEKIHYKIELLLKWHKDGLKTGEYESQFQVEFRIQA